MNNDDYNPWQTMSLNTVPEARFSTRKQLVKTNDISDIAGSKPARRIRAINKPNFHDTSDIRGSRPAQLIPKQVNKPNFVNNTADIDGAQAIKPRKSNRVVDPLNPTYNLPSFKAKPPTPMKFYGDRQMDISDIAGTKPRRPKRASGRDINDTRDIEGSTSDYKTSKLNRRDPPRDFNDVSDIMSTGFKTTRTTNGLKPKYVVNGMVIEDDPGMGPRKLIRERQRGPASFHDVSDIEGANSAYKSQKFANRRQIRNPVAIDDIPGAGADTVRNALRTKRVTNPNNPNYTSLCGSNLGTVTKPSTPDPRNSTFFASLDADGDGQVTYAELLQAADQNHDGSLSVAELHKFAKGKISDKELQRLVRAIDSNNDGVISSNEGSGVGNALLSGSRRSSRAPTARSISSSNQYARGRSRGSTAASAASAGGTDEIDRLRAELEQLRQEASVLKATVPQQSRVPTSRSTPAARSRVPTSSSTAAAARASATRTASTIGSRRSVVTAASRSGESARARRERIATAREIEAVRNLP
eukprot:INCI44.1.p1 GENE.INCI44.1~~INCI44.1.p1  ORF type:complete len:528 (-),score=88.21 INCI44.1:166-1749(-)